MVNQAAKAKICTFFCFNVLYLGSAVVYLFKTYGLNYSKNMMKYDVGPSFSPSQNLRIFIALFVILTVVLGFVAFFVNKPVLFAAVGAELLGQSND